ncbi:MAG: Epimerase [Ilumatobacteraceae bacterium]|nr:Epimerase [Ilumatobacteraceae bacterium]
MSGASGLIGSALNDRLRSSGHTVTALVRRPAGAGEIRWDPAAGSIPDGALDGVDGIVNLAGAGINDHRWTDDYKQTLVESRLNSTRLLVEAVATARSKPAVLVSGSAIGYYGDRGDEELDEQAPPGETFLARLCVGWEAAAAEARRHGVRVVTVRTGIVLTPKGGALKKELPLFKLGLGGSFGSGRQWQSWISLDDEVGAIEHLLAADVDGPANLTAPNPVTNAEFTKTLANAVHRPAVLRIPSVGPKLLLGSELAEALLFTGQRVVPNALQASGYAFAHPLLADALGALLA